MTCSKPTGFAGSHTPKVEILGYGTVPYDAAVTTKITYGLTITSVSPA